MNLKQEVHDRLWTAFQRWQALRETGVTKHDLKMRGLRECGDANRYTRSLIFTGNTLRSYESVLKHFVEFAHHEHGVTRLEEIGKKDFRAFMDRAIECRLAVKTLNRYRSALAKFGALTGQTESFAALSSKYGWRIRQMAKEGKLSSPSRSTPSREVLDRAVAVLQDRDARHFDRTGQERAYHLAARLQLETAARSVSVTERITAASLRDGNQVVLISKGGKEMTFTLAPDLPTSTTGSRTGSTGIPVPWPARKAYQSAYARAIRAVGGRVTGTHGARRRSIQDFYAKRYKNAVGSGLSPQAAAECAAGDALEALGHSRDRGDHRTWYLRR